MPTWLSWLFQNPSAIIAIITLILAILPAGSPLRAILEKLKLLVPQETKLAEIVSRNTPTIVVFPEDAILDVACDVFGEGKKDEADRLMEAACNLRKRRLESEKK